MEELDTLWLHQWNSYEDCHLLVGLENVPSGL